MLEYCYGDDDAWNSHHAMQDHDYHHSPHAGMQMKPPPPRPQYSKQNMMMYNGGTYGYHQDGFPAGGKNNYPNGYNYGQTLQNGYSGSNGYYMSQASMGGNPPYPQSMNASHQFTRGGGDGYSAMTMSSSSTDQYDNYNNNVRPRPMRMQQGGAMEYGYESWGSNTNGYRYNNPNVNCMPYNNGYNHNDDQWIKKSLAN
ncbi:hypothetical protein ACOSP7_018449 [Xanthoceras sorbifolium]